MSASQFVEPIPIREKFASGPAYVEVVDDQLFLIFYVDQIQPPELGMQRERRISVRMVLPAAGGVALLRMLGAALRGDRLHELSAVANEIAC